MATLPFPYLGICRGHPCCPYWTMCKIIFYACCRDIIVCTCYLSYTVI